MDDRQERLDKERMSRLLADAAFIEAPVHAAINGLKVILSIIGVAIFCIVAPVFCYFYSPNAKTQTNERLKRGRYIVRVNLAQPVQTHTADQSKPSIDGYFPMKTITLVFGVVQVEKADTLREDLPYPDPIEFCEPGVKTGLGEISTPVLVPTHHWFLINNFVVDPYVWAEGKDIPMYRAYATAAYTIVELRHQLAAIKYGGTARSACATDELTGHEADIRIDFAPVVQMAYVVMTSPLLWTKSPIPDSGIFGVDDTPDFLIMGICIEGACTPKDFEFDVSLDLKPTYTPHQSAAMAALMSVTSDVYWLATAHANGIHADDRVLAAGRNRRTVAAIYPQPVY